MAVIIRHAGIVVRNIDKALEFYSGILGLQVSARKVEVGQFIDELVGISNVKLEWAKLSDGNGIILELLQYHSQADISDHQNYPSNRHGASHVAFTVENLDTLYKKLIETGLHCNSAPLRSSDGKVKVLYCHDPDGVAVELVEELISK